MKRAMKNIIILSLFLFIVSAIFTFAFKTYGVSNGLRIPDLLKEPDRSIGSGVTQTVTPKEDAAASEVSIEPTKTPEPDTPVQSEDSEKQDTNEKSRYIKDPLDYLVLVNKNIELDPEFAPEDLVKADVPFTSGTTKEEMMLRKDAASALKSMFNGAKKNSIKLFGRSAYRSYASQKSIYDETLRSMGKKYTESYVAVPGQSEHQTGLSIDVTGQTALSKGYKGDFGQTKEGIWLKNNAADYGFILRYPYGKSSVTGYNYEPWHIRYVGVDKAKAIKKSGLVLEEYLK